MTLLKPLILFTVFFILIFLPLTSTRGEEGTVHEVTAIPNASKLNPADLTIRVGDTVKWTNTDEQKHFIASVPGSGPTDELEIFALMEPGDTYSHTFQVAEEYPYFCFIHNQMTGKITVTGN